MNTRSSRSVPRLDRLRASRASSVARHGLTRTSSRGTGFTLVEVLFAVVILGLGMIGIAALFAGTARQQQVASQVTKSVTAAKNVEADAISKFATLESAEGGPCGVGNLPVNDPNYLGGAWKPMISGDTWNELSLQTAPGSGTDCSLRWFRQSAPPFAFYDIAGSTVNYPTDVTPPRLGNGTFTNGTPVGLSGFGVNFPQRRLILDNLKLTVVIRSTATPPTDAPYSGPVGYSVDYAWNPIAGASATCQPAGLVKLVRVSDSLGGTFTDRSDQALALTDYIEIDSQKCPPSSSDSGGTVFSFINSIKISVVTGTRFIESVKASGQISESWDYRSTDVLTLRQRVNTEDNPDGVVDTMAAALLWRRASASSSIYQVAVFTYGLQGDHSTARYLPPENSVSDGSTNRSSCPIRAATVKLLYDNVAGSATYGQFFVDVAASGTGDDAAWLARPGQLILFAGDDTVVPAIPGADNVLHVVKATQTGSKSYRLSLDRGPRSGNKPMLPLNTIAINGGGKQLKIFAVNSAVIALPDTQHVLSPAKDPSGDYSGGTRWELRPIEARVFQAVGR